MQTFMVLAAVFAVSIAKSVTWLKQSELTNELINNPRYLLWETEEGLFEVEDLYSKERSDTPLSISEKDVTFHFFTPENPQNGVEITPSQLDDIVKLTGFNIKRQTLVVIHGWKNDAESSINYKIKNAALINNNINFIVVDWGPIAKKLYLVAHLSVPAIGNIVGDFLLKLNDELNYNISEVTIIGHSLGAHISGIAGARTKGLIGNIIGLDPAGPLFTKVNINNRLDPTDAKYVEVIHTCKLLGFKSDLGHVDYYPNGGVSQPGCGLDLAGSCSHSRSYEYYAESLINDRFVAQECDSYSKYKKNSCSNNTISNMGGYPVNETRHGRFFFETNSESPYARGYIHVHYDKD